MLGELGYKVTRKDNVITAIKKDEITKKDKNIKVTIGSNIITVGGKKKYLNFIVWDVTDVVEYL